MPAVDFLTEPVSHDAARKFIAGKTAVKPEVFEGMLPELRGRAFAVSGIEDLNLLQRLRDRIADLPQGGDWDTIRDEIAADITPFFVDPQAGAEAMKKQLEAAERRAELLVRTHGFQAYAATRYNEQVAAADIQPFWQYKSFGDGRVRDTHRALDGIVLPAGHPFWQDHYPPWEWGCRCIVIGLSPEDVEEIRAEDEGKAPDERRILEGEFLKAVEERKQLIRGPNKIVDLRSPVEKADSATGKNTAYRWNPGDLRPNVRQLRERYSPNVWDAFRQWAGTTDIGDGRTVWTWAEERLAPKPRTRKKPEAEPAKGKPAPAPAPIAPPAPAPTWAELAREHGLNNPFTFTEEKARKLTTALRKEHGITSAEKVTEIRTKVGGGLAKENIAKAVDDFLGMLPRDVVESLPKLKVQVNERIRGPLGDFDRKSNRVRLFSYALGDASATVVEVRRVVFHELTHWLHDNGPQWYRDAIRDLYMARTKGEKPEKVPGYKYPIRKDKWWWQYAGTQYSFRPDNEGTEVATTHVELLASPVTIQSKVAKHGKDLTSAMQTVMSIFTGGKP